VTTPQIERSVAIDVTGGRFRNQVGEAEDSDRGRDTPADCIAQHLRLEDDATVNVADAAVSATHVRYGGLRLTEGVGDPHAVIQQTKCDRGAESLGA
jgi:hypothetical protein